MKRLRFPVAIWRDKDGGHTYAFPLGAKDPYGHDVYPLLNNQAWEYRGTLPQGMPVTNIKKGNEHRVSCSLAGSVVYTGDWAIEDDDASSSKA